MLGFYYREVIDNKGKYYKDFPIPRFLCHGKGNRLKTTHKTFSLLHYHLVPYCKYSISFIIKVLRTRHIDKKSYRELQNYISNFPATSPTSSDYDYIELSISRICSFQNLIKETINKIIVSRYFYDITGYWHNKDKDFSMSENEIVIIRTFLGFCSQFECHKTNHPIRGPCALSLDFYITGGSYLHNSHFLFGTPSQFRSIKK